MDSLKRMVIKGYRSIRDVDLDLYPLNVLIGANGAGKSNFVAFFKLLNEMMAGRLQQYIGTTGRAQSVLHYGPKVTPQMEATLEFETRNGIDRYVMRLFHAANDTLVFADEIVSFHKTGYLDPQQGSLGAGHQETRIGEHARTQEPTAKVATVCKQLLNKCRVYHFHDTSPTARARQYGLIDDNRWLMPDAGNLAAMLYLYRQQAESAYRRIVSTIKKIMPEFADFELAPDRLNPREIALNWRRSEADYLFGPHQISDGSLRAMALATLLLQPEADLPNVIILDEPELGLHPHALEIVAGVIQAASHSTQVVVATQSQTFLDYFDPADIVVVESIAGASQFRRLDVSELAHWLDSYSIGELWEKNVIRGGGPLQ